jgi:ABC-type branched-subunit amino acid transport system ATPase component/ABC-type branched-subunit amino acid transport system permease subunit
VKQLRTPLWICGLAVTAAVFGAAGWLSPAQAAILTYGVVAGILAISLNLLMGYAGQISLAQASFLGLGSFVTGFVVTHIGGHVTLGLPLSLAASIVLGAAVAVVVGLPAIRLRGVYLAIATFAFADAFDNYIFNIQKLTGLGSGITVARPRLGPLHLKTDPTMLTFALVCLAIAWLVDTRLVAIRHGRALLAIRENEQVAASFGVPVAREKLRAFLMCGALAGLAGCLYAYQVQVVVKSSYALQVSLMYLIIIVVGGLGSRAGVVLAAVLFTLLPYWFSFLKGWDIIIAPLLLIYTVVVNPGGLPDHLRRVRERSELKHRRQTGEDVAGLRPNIAVRSGGRTTLKSVGGDLLAVRDVSVRFGGLTALSDVSIDVPEGGAVGLIGPNGAGKSTLFNVVSGFQKPGSGSVQWGGRDITTLAAHERAALGISRTFQHVGLVRRATLLDNLLLAQHVRLGYGAVAGLTATGATLRRESEGREEAMALLDEIGLADFADLRVEVLSTGQQRLVELACAVASRPRLVLLDEPSAGMSPAAAEHLAEQVVRLRANYATALLLIEHHIPLVSAVCEKTYVLDAGRVIAQGPVKSAIRDPGVVTAYMGEAAL